jgi:CRP/FNR family transcriptional regulator, cyclic AMP receptor protein
MSPLKERTFDPRTFLAQAGWGRTILQYRKNKVIFAQGEPCDSVFYIQVGRVKLTVRSMQGKELPSRCSEQGTSLVKRV